MKIIIILFQYIHLHFKLAKKSGCELLEGNKADKVEVKRNFISTLLQNGEPINNRIGIVDNLLMGKFDIRTIELYLDLHYLRCKTKEIFRLL
ncbi:MAG: hypothetical protein ACTSRG_20545 [Candidatus Helarchaeota archaeon]